MASSNEGGIAAAAAEQLGSMALGKSGERKEDIEAKNTEPTTKNGTPTKLCSACGKKSKAANALKKCNGCKCVWYCDKKCQNKHRKVHKHECKVIMKELDKRGGKLDVGTELDLGPLEKLPPREECPICMRALPIHTMLQTQSNCCGKTVCGGCDFQHQRKSRELAVPLTCEFCREPVPESDEEVSDEAILAQIRKRAELKDPDALNNLAVYYGDGDYGLSVDQAKCIDLLRESADHGFPDAQYNLGKYYHFSEMGLEQNDEEALKYYKKAADGGHVLARHNLGCVEERKGDLIAAMRHFRLSASGGFKPSMTNLIIYFENGDLHHADLAETTQTFYRSRAEMKSEDRDKYIAYLKKVGEYEAKYEW